MFGDDADREQFFEAARRQAQREFEQDNTNAQALVRWGGALLELAHYKQGDESTNMIEQAISKLSKALEIDPSRADAEWCLGNACTSLGFLCPTKTKAQEQFSKAAEYFRRCQQKDPNNDTYKKALEMCDKAPEYYDEIQSQLKASGGVGGDSSGKEEASPNEFWWDVAGWALLAGVVVGVLVLAKGAASPATGAAK